MHRVRLGVDAIELAVLWLLANSIASVSLATVGALVIRESAYEAFRAARLSVGPSAEELWLFTLPLTGLLVGAAAEDWRHRGPAFMLLVWAIGAGASVWLRSAQHSSTPSTLVFWLLLIAAGAASVLASMLRSRRRR